MTKVGRGRAAGGNSSRGQVSLDVAGELGRFILVAKGVLSVFCFERVYMD